MFWEYVPIRHKINESQNKFSIGFDKIQFIYRKSSNSDNEYSTDHPLGPVHGAFLRESFSVYLPLMNILTKFRGQQG